MMMIFFSLKGQKYFFNVCSDHNISLDMCTRRIFILFFQPPLTRLSYHISNRSSTNIFYRSQFFLIGRRRRRHRSIKHSILCVHISFVIPASLPAYRPLSLSRILRALWRIAVPSRWKKNELFIIVFAQPVH